MELVFVAFAGVTTLLFILLLFSLFGSSPSDDVRLRMEEYLAESEVAAKRYASPEERLESTAIDNVPEDDAWLKESREGESAVKKVIANVGVILTPKGMAVRLAEKLSQAGIPLKANEFVAITFLATILPAIAGTVIFQNTAMGFMTGILGYAAPNLWLAIARSRRMTAFAEQIQDTLTMLSNGLKAGYSLLQSMDMVAREAPPPMSVELKRVLKENSLGMDLEEALQSLNKRVVNEDWDLVTTVVLIQRQVGGNLAEILDKISYTIRQRQRIKGDIQTKTAQAKVSGLIVGSLPIALGLMIYVVNPAFMMRLFTFRHGWYRGWFLVVFGIIWEIVGMIIIMRIVDIEV